ncbi:hypothetical protein GCM10023213_35570 [Prosthecobacter algae]|uniref:Uncharacterized protein n=1 Tax=Prosthecobacter algae TaxID=1144682 RepID=A0ABP9PEF2_9BACT
MAIFGILFLGVALVLIGVGIALGLAAIVAAAGLISLGVLSSSVLIGLRTGRTESGIRALFIQCGVLAGIPAGAICAWALKHFSEQIGDGWVVPAYGALGGALAGLCLALIMDAISRRTHAWASRQLAKTNLLSSDIQRPL